MKIQNIYTQVAHYLQPRERKTNKPKLAYVFTHSVNKKPQEVGIHFTVLLLCLLKGLTILGLHRDGVHRDLPSKRFC